MPGLAKLLGSTIKSRVAGSSINSEKTEPGQDMPGEKAGAPEQAENLKSSVSSGCRESNANSKDDKCESTFSGAEGTNCAGSKTDSKNTDPSQAMPDTGSSISTRQKDLRDKIAPKCKKSSTNSGDSGCEKLRTKSGNPNHIQSDMESGNAIQTTPNKEEDASGRAKLFSDVVDPE